MKSFESTRSLGPREADGTTLTVVLPLPPNLANWRAHWAKKVRVHNEWKERAIAESRELRGRRPRRPFERVTVSAVLYVGCRMDDDNAVSRLKWCLDLLKERGLIVDDKRPHLELEGIPEQRTGSKRRVELTLRVA